MLGYIAVAMLCLSPWLLVGAIVWCLGPYEHPDDREVAAAAFFFAPVTIAIFPFYLLYVFAYGFIARGPKEDR